MADDTIDLERSKLEGKDRAQLVTIATALGTKPPARAKKADIVTLILDANARRRSLPRRDRARPSDLRSPPAAP